MERPYTRLYSTYLVRDAMERPYHGPYTRLQYGVRVLYTYLAMCVLTGSPTPAPAARPGWPPYCTYAAIVD